ncbi:hypothetical protein ACFLW1_01390 [Chloroflexota bacterium]
MKRYSYFLLMAALFLVLSGITYFIHYLIFRDVHHIFIYMVGDLAFLPLEVFIVIIVIERILSYREKRAILVKMNMVIGAFFSETGNFLLGYLPRHFTNREEIARNLNVRQDWMRQDFKRAGEYAHNLKIELDIHKVNLAELKSYLETKRTFLLTLMENPNLLEHDRFTDLLWATTHLDEELASRPSLENIPESDLAHLAIDIERTYDHLASEWLDYAEHIKANYPFLFSLLVRTHPFQDNPSATVM